VVTTVRAVESQVGMAASMGVLLEMVVVVMAWVEKGVAVRVAGTTADMMAVVAMAVVAMAAEVGLAACGAVHNIEKIVGTMLCHIGWAAHAS